MTKIFKLFFNQYMMIALLVLMILWYVLAVVTHIDPPQRLFGNTVVAYQLDVYINSNHVAKHASSADAIRCLTNKGTSAALSEKFSRNLHLICFDEEKQTVFDIIISRINKFVPRWENPNAYLITAHAPEGAGTLEQYITHIMTTKNAIKVGLIFKAGEVVFVPR